jgi:hypothetical protein
METEAIYHLKCSFSNYTNQCSTDQSKGHLGGRKFFLEIPDLMRYMNTVIFLYHITSRKRAVAFNRLGTHPIENLFGYVRIKSHFAHTWPKFLMSVARAIFIDDVVTRNNMKPPIRREFSIAGVKILSESQHATMAISLPDDFPRVFVGRLIDHLLGGEEKEDNLWMIRIWTEATQQLSDWKKAGNSMKMYHSGIIANHTILSRSIGFGKDGQKSKAEEFVWTPAKRRQARRLHIRLNNAAIAAKMGCPEQDLSAILGEGSEILDMF